MIWLAWRQHRRQAYFTLAALAVLAAFMVPSGLAMRRSYRQLGLADCVRARPDGSVSQAFAETCNANLTRFSNQYASLLLVGVLFLVLPLLVGLFWGAPLVAREVEHGTHRLVWTQGISRRHWALVKIGVVGTATLAIGVLYGLGVAWWLTPLNAAQRQGRFDYFIFDMAWIVPIGYTLFAVALGVFAGTVWHKVLPAMAVTLVGFLGLRLGLAALARPRYLAARTLTYPLVGKGEAPNTGIGDWVLARGIRDASGRMVAANAEIACPVDATGPGAGCGVNVGLGPGAYNWQLYQPADRFWLFQGIETGIFVALAVLLLYFAVRRIRRMS